MKINDDTTWTSESQDLHTTHMSSYKASRCYGSRNQGSKGAVNDNMSGSGSMAKRKRLKPRRNTATRLSDQDSDQGWVKGKPRQDLRGIEG